MSMIDAPLTRFHVAVLSACVGFFIGAAVALHWPCGFSGGIIVPPAVETACEVARTMSLKSTTQK